MTTDAPDITRNPDQRSRWRGTRCPPVRYGRSPPRGRALAVRLWYGKRSRRYPLSHERAKVTMRWHGGHRRPPRREATSMHRRFTSFVAHVLVACVPVLGLVMAV